MELQSFDLGIKHITGSKNVFADYLSRSNNNNSDLSCILHEEREKEVKVNVGKEHKLMESGDGSCFNIMILEDY